MKSISFVDIYFICLEEEEKEVPVLNHSILTWKPNRGIKKSGRDLKRVGSETLIIIINIKMSSRHPKQEHPCSEITRFIVLKQGQEDQ